MSETRKRPYAQVLRIAEGVKMKLLLYCDRIEIAGSLRRQKAMIGDIEIVAIPSAATDLFGNRDTSAATQLDAYLEKLISDSKIRHTNPKRWGSKLKAFTLESTSGEEYQVDLFLQPDPATWGCNLMIRTGCANFSRTMVSRFKPDGYLFKDGRLYKDCLLYTSPSPRDPE